MSSTQASPILQLEGKIEQITVPAKTLQKSTLTPGSRRFLKRLSKQPELLTSPVSHFMAALGFSRDSFYDWSANPEFIAELNRISEQAFGVAKSRIRQKVLEEALKNSQQDRKLFFQLIGDLDESPKQTAIINVELPDWAKDAS